jgi:hypothetical protein
MSPNVMFQYWCTQGDNQTRATGTFVISNAVLKHLKPLLLACELHNALWLTRSFCCVTEPRLTPPSDCDTVPLDQAHFMLLRALPLQPW